MNALLRVSRSKALRDNKGQGEDTLATSTYGGNIETIFSTEYKRKSDNKQWAVKINSAEIEVAEKTEDANELPWKSDTQKDINELAAGNNFDKKKDGTEFIPGGTEGALTVSLSMFDSADSDDMNFLQEAVRYNEPARCTLETMNSCFSLMKINSGGLENVENMDKVKIRYSNASIYRRTSEGTAPTKEKLKRHQFQVKRFSLI